MVSNSPTRYGCSECANALRVAERTIENLESIIDGLRADLELALQGIIKEDYDGIQEATLLPTQNQRKVEPEALHVGDQPQHEVRTDYVESLRTGGGGNLLLSLAGTVSAPGQRGNTVLLPRRYKGRKDPR